MRHPFASAFTLCLAVGAALADPPDNAMPLGPAAALECVAARYRGEALRIRDDGLVQEVRWLTPAGNVLQIEMTGPGCRFLEVEGVGQSEARILPGQTR
ncbi:MAG: Cys/Met metabolism pyridoxal-phosphate-dependent enzyme [Paracoccaceae bacterium]